MRDWTKFYDKGEAPTKPSSFAKFCFERFEEKPLLIWDVGSGNGRDTYYFASKGNYTIGVDKNWTPQERKNAYFRQQDAGRIKDLVGDVFYSRFFLHSINQKRVEHLIKRADCRYFMAECRAVGDEPVVYADHERHMVDGDWLLRTLQKYGYEILYFSKGRGVAKYKGEDPLTIRVIARK